MWVMMRIYKTFTMTRPTNKRTLVILLGGLYLGEKVPEYRVEAQQDYKMCAKLH